MKIREIGHRVIAALGILALALSGCGNSEPRIPFPDGTIAQVHQQIDFLRGECRTYKVTRSSATDFSVEVSVRPCSSRVFRRQ